ncbi:MAG: hypothetical protein OHK0023_11590 [Anaerolineae bacterium]
MAVNTDILKLKEEQQQGGQSLLQLALRRIRRDKLTLIALTVVFILTALAITAPLIEAALGVSYSRTSPTNAFLPPGGTQRLIYLPDFPLLSQTVQVVVLADVGRNTAEVGETNFQIQPSQFALNTGGSGLVVVNAVFGAPPINVTVNDATRPAATRVAAGKSSLLADLTAGKVNLVFRDATNPDAPPLAELKDVEAPTGSLITAVLMGKLDSTDEQYKIQAKAYAVPVTGIEKGTANLQVIHASTEAPQVNVFVGSEKVISNITYGDGGTHTSTAGRITTGISDVNGRQHILGTDDLGSDHLARLLYAGQISLGIAFLAAIISVTIGVTMGIIAGFYGGLIDDALNWFITTVSSLPTLLLLLIIVALLNPGPGVLIAVLGLLGWFGICRLVRGETLSIRAREYIVSARAIGAPVSRIMFVHILPNLLSVVIVALALDIGNLILVESALSFLGFGIKPPSASWGNMLSNAQTFFNKGVHLVIFPGLMITITVLCLYVIGDGLRDAFDPTIKN